MDGKLNGREVVAADFGKGDGAPTFAESPSNGPLEKLKIEFASAALSNVLANAGCSLRRDFVDARLIDEVKSFGTRGKKSATPKPEAGGVGESKGNSRTRKSQGD